MCDCSLGFSEYMQRRDQVDQHLFDHEPERTLHTIRREQRTEQIRIQANMENLAEAWDRFHELLRKCPHHRLTRWMQVHTFHNGLRNATRTVIDASAGGALMKKTIDQAYEILEDAATNTNQWPREKATPVKEVGGTDNEVLNNLVNHVAQLTKQLTRQQGTANAIQTNPRELCEF